MQLEHESFFTKTYLRYPRYSIKRYKIRPHSTVDSWHYTAFKNIHYYFETDKSLLTINEDRYLHCPLCRYFRSCSCLCVYVCVCVCV